MQKHYLFVLVLTILGLTAACESLPFGQAAATDVPFARFTAQDVFNSFSQAGLQVDSVTRDMLIGRDAPGGFSDRYVFEIPRVAPLGGQVLIFDTPAEMGEWLAFVETLRSNPDTRRDVIYVYPYANILLQLNANLLPAEANQFREAMVALGSGT
ncbi:MAG: hypothetical protein U0452_07075 [Anaerolineae bacterium]